MKMNQDGRECPSWCVQEHGDPDDPWMCAGSPRIPGGAIGGARMMLGSHLTSSPRLAVWTFGNGEIATVYAASPPRAAGLAGFLENLSGLEPAQIRALAASAREAAAEGFE